MIRFFIPAIFFCIITLCTTNTSVAQSFLEKNVSVSVSKAPLWKVLSSMEQQGGFFFSYANNLINADSIVSISVKNKKVSFVLKTLFENKFTYTQHNKHLIISDEMQQGALEINGTVVDRSTGAAVPYATVYERSQLRASMTDENGIFRLMLKKRGPNDSITVSRVSYADTTVALAPDQAGNLKIMMSVIDKPLDSVVIDMMAKRDWLARTLLSSKQIMSSVNLNDFFVNQPFQVSILPGLASRGKMSSQLVNKFSFNILGGYNGGVNGVELGGLYNITNKDVRYVQVAGLFNSVGGKMEGVQLAGLFNYVGNADGVQVGGLYNHTITSKGVQMAGLYNHADTMHGFQIAGLMNRAKTSNGVQIAGLVNKTDSSHGVQIAGIVNINRKFKGFQIGLINIADTLEGIPIGLLNISKNAYHKISPSFNEMGMLMLSFKSGNPAFYNIFTAGISTNQQQKAYAYGYGFGSDLNLVRNHLFLNPELVSLYFYNGNSQKQNISARAQMNLKFRIFKHLSISAGPSFTVLRSKPGLIPVGYKEDLSNGSRLINIGKNANGWFGWHIGLEFL